LLLISSLLELISENFRRKKRIFFNSFSNFQKIIVIFEESSINRRGLEYILLRKQYFLERKVIVIDAAMTGQFFIFLNFLFEVIYGEKKKEKIKHHQK
jgi:hypothetical protein